MNGTISHVLHATFYNHGIVEVGWLASLKITSLLARLQNASSVKNGPILSDGQGSLDLQRILAKRRF